MTNIKHSKNNSGRVIAGFILLVIGSIMLLRNFGFFFPGWLFSWPMLLIALGLYTGSKSNFQSTGSYILLLIGGVFLIQRFFAEIEIKAFFIPALFIIGGLWIIFGRKKRVTTQWEWDKRMNADSGLTEDGGNQGATNFTSDDIIDSVSVFGGVKRTIMSKNFKGGDVVNIFGGAEINLMQADFDTPAVLDVTQIFGGTKIIVPSNWIIQSEMTAVFGGIEDKRAQYLNAGDTGKLIIIKGTSIFGGITIVSF